MIQGLRTVCYHVGDLVKAKAWYTDVVGHGPYFDQPFYVGYTVGGFELGLVPDGKPGAGGTEVYWGVPDAKAAIERLRSKGAKVLDDVRDVGEGILVAKVADPFGNEFGVIQNPHFKLDDVR
jgi:predicted enzyme related to lactoylglutathione lyase